MKEYDFKEIPSVWKGRRIDRTRGRRILPEKSGYFVHVTSRAVHQRFLFKSNEKNAFSELMEKWSDFSGIQVLTYCLMDNHFHLFLWIPPVEPVKFAELIRRLQRVWEPEKVQKWLNLYQISPEREQMTMRQSLENRMMSLPSFMRVLKQSFSVWFNAQHNVSGTLWEGRYRSMIVKNTPNALMSVATYIDLNPVRAGICSDPKNYAWSSYGQASKGNPVCQQNILQLLNFADWQRTPAIKTLKNEKPEQVSQSPSWGECDSVYRPWLYEKGYRSPQSRKNAHRKGFTSFEVLNVFHECVQEHHNEHVCASGEIKNNP